MATITLERVEKRFPDGFAAVRDLSLAVRDGELLVLVGPSGSGKSTVLRLIAGLEHVTAGTIRIGDRDVTHLPPRERDVAFVFQSYALYPHMSVRENLGFGLRMRKLPTSEIRSRVEVVAVSLGLAGLLERRPAQLSGGQRQRVALGRAIVREPHAFLLDEPLSNLDARLRVETRAELARLHRQLGATMVHVTHDQTEAMTLGERVGVLNEGVLHQLGPPLELYDHPADTFVASFIGTPGMNLVPGRLGRSGEGWEFVGSGLRLDLPASAAAHDAEVRLGIRPHQLEPAAAGDGDFGPAVVTMVEALGNEQVIHLSTGEDVPLVAVTDRARQLRADDRVSLRTSPSTVHLFDAASGKRLGAPAG